MSHANERVRKHTARAVLRRIDDGTEQSLLQHAKEPAAIPARLAELEREWDIDRAIETEASVMGLIGLALGTSVRREFLAVPLVVGSAVLLYAFTGRYPLLPVFRRLGLRTAREIARERYALKALRGDFSNMDSDHQTAAGGSATSEGEQSRPPGLVGSTSGA